jgi:hypothetical protein
MKKLVHAALAALLLAAACVAPQARQSQFPTARLVWQSIVPDVQAGLTVVPEAEATIQPMTDALAAGDRVALSFVPLATLLAAAEAGLVQQVQAQEIAPEIADYLRQHHQTFGALILSIIGGAQ